MTSLHPLSGIVPKTKIRQNLEEFANTFLEFHKDKLVFDLLCLQNAVGVSQDNHPIPTFVPLSGIVPNPLCENTILEWQEENGCKWYLRKTILCSANEPNVTEYRLRRIYEKQTKLKSEKQIFDECWVYLPHEYVYIGKLKNDSRNATIGGYYFEKYSGYSPKNSNGR